MGSNKEVIDRGKWKMIYDLSHCILDLDGVAGSKDITLATRNSSVSAIIEDSFKGDAKWGCRDTSHLESRVDTSSIMSSI